MTHERREEVVLVALVVSVALHVGLMWYVRPQVMTQVMQAERHDRRPSMRVMQRQERPEPVKIEELMDLKALKDAPPAVEDTSAPRADGPSASVPEVRVPEAEAVMPAAPEPEKAAVFDTRPLNRDRLMPTVVPVTRIETPNMTSAAVPAPTFSVSLPKAVKEVAPPPVTSGRDAQSVFLPARIEKKEAPAVTFTPAEEIYEKVDEKVVEEEKAAVRERVDSTEAEDLKKFVNIVMKTTVAGGWRYFKLLMTPRTSLAPVPKDVVMVIDGSGSIGNDRLGSCRKAARRILRTCTNTGDRFNLVVFRNAFSYAFRSWRPCDAASFAAGDKWLSNQTAHGRTDVFSTISSVLTLPRDPMRPLIALVVTDGDANMGVSDTAEILSKFTALNDGLVSVYMYGVKSSANRELIDVLTHGNRGESFVFDGWRWSAGEGMEELSDRFRDPVLSDLRLVYASDTNAESYPRLLRNLYRGGTLECVGRVPAATREIAFSLKGLNGADAYEGFFKLPVETAADDPKLVAEWEAERSIDRKLGAW